MANLTDYIKWRGDLAFDSVPLNEIDAAIFSQISYWNMDGIVSADPAQQMTISALCKSTVLEELPPYCSFIDERETEPFTGQHPVNEAARFPSP